MKIFKLFLVLPILTVMFSGCTSMRSVEAVDSNEKLLENLNPGDLIRIETKDGNTHEIRVGTVTRESVAGDGVEVPFDQIKTLEVKRVSTTKTAGLVGGTLLMYVLVFSAALSALL